ncbi:hypothetical protein [Ktedonobacter racemifer]|uniref:Uncharacterized protein n=1 Tax=Ktedonobacter racemifer DSM 44963 TaxID=485913 RepID=D6TY09_KTERA|nr:hypothetical protein [Ktedonobacter racemifer]EFH85005.1 hypothetical protein Krac_6137 [Ktedonobacter racemifer DSM 44963]
MTQYAGTSWSFPGIPHTGYSPEYAADTRHLNHVLQEQGPLVLPRISPFPVHRVWWTMFGPLASLQVPPGHPAARQKLLSPREWQSLLLVTGVVSHASSHTFHAAL